MTIPGNLLTTAMAVMPHTDEKRALELSLSVDVPFWPQLPNYSYYEDMYVQAAEHFPGILLDLDKRTLKFPMDKFILELEESLSHFDDPSYFDISREFRGHHTYFFGFRPGFLGFSVTPNDFSNFSTNWIFPAGRPVLSSFCNRLRIFAVIFSDKN